MSERHDSERDDCDHLAAVVAESVGWADLMRRLGVEESSGQRRALQKRAAEYDLDTSHFKRQSITLHIDHVSGDWLDNRAENLRYLCPNCHAATETWCRSGRKTR